MMTAVLAFGRGEDGQLGAGDTSDVSFPQWVEALENKDVAQIACGSGHSLIVTSNGAVYTWGRGDDGRLGHSDMAWKYIPRLVSALVCHKVVQATCGSYHTAAVTEDGHLYTWGGGMYGKLGHGNEMGHSTPTRVEALFKDGIKVTSVACGSRHTVALDAEGQIFSWGDRELGVVGHGVADGHQYTPLQVSGADLALVTIKQISACGFHTLALSEGGDVYSWGEGKFGRLGIGNEDNQLTPMRVPPNASWLGDPVVQVTCGGFHSALVTEMGRCYTCGGGEHGQLGHGEKANKMVFMLVESLRTQTVRQVTCGWSHTVALTDEGKCFSWGNADHGKLGHGPCQKVTIPRLVENLADKKVVQVASYNEHTAVVVESCQTLGALSSHFVNDMLDMLEGEDNFADVTFLVEGQRIGAHKAFLAARSKHFRAMFLSGMRESHSGAVISIPSTSACVFRALLEYLYTDRVRDDLPPVAAVELYIAADLYNIERLQILCEGIIAQGLGVDSAPALLQISDDLGASRPREVCLRWIVDHFDTVSKTASFKSLSKELILDVILSR